MESISVKALNEVLAEDTREKYFLNESRGHWGVGDNSEGVQEDYNETFKYYRHPDMPSNVFLQVTEHTDSYGDDPKVTEFKFVTGKEKQVTVYEPVDK